MTEGRQFAASPPLRWLVVTAYAGALVAAVLFSSQIYFSMLDHDHDYWRIWLWQGVQWGYWAVVSPWVLRSGIGFLKPAGRPRFWLMKFAGFAAAVIGGQLLVGATALAMIQPYVPIATYGYLESLDRTWGAWATVGPVVFGVLVATGYGIGGFWEARRREVRESRLEAELARAQLQALRLEIQPHFLFNSLNGIAAQVRRNQNDKALEMLLRLSELLRATLEHSGGPLVSLEDEIDFVRNYLELQTVRFADRLRVEYDVPKDCLASRMPFLLLQPLAENTIQHGLASNGGVVNMKIGAELSNGDLVLTVSDDGPGLPEGFELGESDGVGLSNTLERLMKIYEAQSASLEVFNRDGGGTVSRVVIPQETSLPAADMTR